MTPSEVIQDHYEAIEVLAKRVARQVARQFAVEVEDLTQEALTWCLLHPEKFMGHWSDEDRRRGERFLVADMRNWCRNYAAKEQRARGGLLPADQFWYRGLVIEELLKYAFDESASLSPPPNPNQTRGRQDPAEGNNWVTFMADIRKALETLSDADLWLLKALYANGLSQARVGELSDPPVSQQKVSRRAKRAIAKVQDALGGPRPKNDPPEPGWEQWIGTRKAVSNAKARAITDGGFDD